MGTTKNGERTRQVKWFMSYIQVYRDGRFMFGHHVWHHESEAEHPIAMVERWNKEYGGKDGYTTVLLFFQEVYGNFPNEVDTLSNGIGP